MSIPGSQTEQTVSKVYHIHLDTRDKTIDSDRLHHRLRTEFGFLAHDFFGHPDGHAHFGPTGHSSIKLSDRQAFESLWDQVIALVQAEPKVIGYMEGEFVPTDVAIPYVPATDFSLPQFQIKRRRLDSSRGERFRQTELHLVCDWQTSDKRVIDALLQAGLYGALLHKQAGWQAIVLTIQGHPRFIHPLINALTEYLKFVGGLTRATIKEEVALRSQLFHMTPEELPEIIDEVVYR